jgi:putative membrane protein
VLLLHAGTTTTWWHWHLHPDVVLLCLFLETAYLYAVTQLRASVSDAGRVRRTQVASFSAGVIVVYLAAGSPMHDVSENYLLSAHMPQHTLFTLVAAPLLLAGIPGWLWQVPLRSRAVLAVARVIVHPLVILFVVNGVFLITHLPFAMDFSLSHHWFHFVVHVLLLATALLMWWPILSDVPELPRYSYPLQMAYLFAQSLIPSVLASFITFADTPVYSFYEQAPRLWGLGVVTDQQIAGGLMKVMGSLILWSFIGVAFFKWYNREASEAQEPRWDEVQEELDRMGLTTKRGS